MQVVGFWWVDVVCTAAWWRFFRSVVYLIMLLHVSLVLQTLCNLQFVSLVGVVRETRHMVCAPWGVLRKKHKQLSNKIETHKQHCEQQQDGASCAQQHPGGGGILKQWW